MILNTSLFAMTDSNLKDLDISSNKRPTIDDLRKEGSIETTKAKTVHRRRDLDSLG